MSRISVVAEEDQRDRHHDRGFRAHREGVNHFLVDDGKNDIHELGGDNQPESRGDAQLEAEFALWPQ
jgi:hypothetical protein